MKKTLKRFKKLPMFIARNYRQIFVTTMIWLLILISCIIFYTDRTVLPYEGITQCQAEIYVYKNCHKMCNNFIIADDGEVRGFVRADEENIDNILSVLYEYDIDNSDEIIDCLEEFKEEDYHSAVWLHNYCWNRLDGEIGYAVGLKSRYE